MAVATIKRAFKAQYCHWDQDGNGLSHLQDGTIFFEDGNGTVALNQHGKSGTPAQAAERTLPALINLVHVEGLCPSHHDTWNLEAGHDHVHSCSNYPNQN